eukprot:CAMPEP_0183305666 /NCGR_PEP_ID=MMETSP0160_2-20130417/10330_1 /TAXON_ID=2839 ORGANISM="Odontella Sinensis, Strain Grunow 1884" /NCGR_SAMPLE_ID=MMETSP0160_2 /ASSEMBLY_ACC=CAM_ASM_000250 /LENGTH=201 /DNA_ID=CAMNT_0025468901 /DNA_START=87 /DNA_END=692 /DNA_ORIENTATION=+
MTKRTVEGEENDEMDNEQLLDGSEEPPSQGSDEPKDKKRRERLEQNRISARESRKRKKTMIEELQRTVITLSRENKELNDRNESLRRQLMEIGAKYPNIVPLHAIMGVGGPNAPGMEQQPATQPAAAAAGGTVPQVPPMAGQAGATPGVPAAMMMPGMYPGMGQMPGWPGAPAGGMPQNQQAQQGGAGWQAGQFSGVPPGK